jgi:putative membrane protein insertion efficiency factor
MTQSIGRWLAAKAVRVYQTVVSPWLPPACRFTPTCSEYAAEAFEHYGFWRGGVFTIRRLLRCHPLHRGGFDPLT